jgi:hypothetical protein
METPMVYAVSDRSGRAARNAGVIAGGRVKRRPGSIAIHWPRVIALSLNTLVWVAIIAVMRGLLRR